MTIDYVKTEFGYSVVYDQDLDNVILWIDRVRGKDTWIIEYLKDGTLYRSPVMGYQSARLVSSKVAEYLDARAALDGLFKEVE